jgi:U4/U6 small nuclear ribonucleoprotein PRP31
MDLAAAFLEDFEDDALVTSTQENNNTQITSNSSVVSSNDSKTTPVNVKTESSFPSAATSTSTSSLSSLLSSSDEAILTSKHKTETPQLLMKPVIPGLASSHDNRTVHNSGPLAEFDDPDLDLDKVARELPNLSNLLGASIAAKLVELAGGLESLCNTPSSVVQLIGKDELQKKQQHTGFGFSKVQGHMGILKHSKLISNAPSDLRVKALRLVSAKVALAARIDFQSGDASGMTGQKFHDTISRRLEKLQEPPAPKKVKALPRPDEERKKRRGGKRFRRQREEKRLSEYSKQRNRLKFGVAEITDDYTGEGFGMIGQAGTGMLKAARPRAKQKLVGGAKRALAKARAQAAAASNSGLASSLSFTPVQGIELVNPHAQQAAQNQKHNKYFSDTLSFVSRPVSKKAKFDLPSVPKFE